MNKLGDIYYSGIIFFLEKKNIKNAKKVLIYKKITAKQ